MDFKKNLEMKLEHLKNEYSLGEKRLIELDKETMNLKSTMLRISGAIHVIEEAFNTQKEEGSSKKSTSKNQKSTK
ncbi:hypothetical protein U6A24_02505 [Aquimarina gracilis]|uniref:Uncharacterized protein n=1 Tax=Aquimarina gracilis TaxID=874422 RepID=A0ABU5ZSQ7_9FLAO|nr:hypothetical protein [Aquimarina gracilis]MEB3344311.1 hypothetical protein [Aquimarina gracilis]